MAILEYFISLGLISVDWRPAISIHDALDLCKVLLTVHNKKNKERDRISCYIVDNSMCSIVIHLYSTLKDVNRLYKLYLHVFGNMYSIQTIKSMTHCWKGSCIFRQTLQEQIHNFWFPGAKIQQVSKVGREVSLTQTQWVNSWLLLINIMATENFKRDAIIQLLLVCKLW